VSNLPPALVEHPELDTWIRVDPHETITVFTGKAELGQGLTAALARIAAEELDVDITRVRVETADTSRPPFEGPTVGSLSMQQTGSALRQAAAEAKAHLLQLAAAALDAQPVHLDVSDGVFTHPDRRDRVDYWQLLGGGRFDFRASGAASPKPPHEHRIIGRPGPRSDLLGIVTGTTRFAADLVSDGTLHSRVVRPPSPAARLLGFDEERLRSSVELVAVVRQDTFLAVVADHEHDAVAAAETALRIAQWSEEPVLPPAGHLANWLVSLPAQTYHVVDGRGTLDQLPTHEEPRDAATVLRARYSRPYQMHASLGPSAAAALWEGGRVTVWTHSQAVQLLRVLLADEFGLDREHVRLVHVPGPGCYGHNGADDVAFEAAIVARALEERCVLHKWSRADEHAWEPYGPAMVLETGASLSAQGDIVDWECEAWTNTHVSRPYVADAGNTLVAARHRAPPKPERRPPLMLDYHAGGHRNADPLYTFPRRITINVVPTPLRVSSLRALGAYAHVFAIESFVDELAEAAGADPVEFRLRHLEDDRARAVLEAAAQAAGWGRSLDGGRGLGIGFAQYKNSACYAAVAIEVEVDDATAEIRPLRVFVAADAGEVIDPDGLENQLAGGAVQSLSWTLKEQVTFDNARITSLDWSTYPILTFVETPEVDVTLLDRPGEPYLGAGEATQGPTAAALANAAYAAVGLRLRDIPLTPDAVRRAAQTV
jgi:CO/xanthine dehydrogenase Mo-binding subunit